MTGFARQTLCGLPLKIGENGTTQPRPTQTVVFRSHVDYWSMSPQSTIFIVLLPTWGDKFSRAWGRPEIFDEQNAFAGKWLVKDTVSAEHHLDAGGDRALENANAIIDAMAAGKSAGDTHLRHSIPAAHFC